MLYGPLTPLEFRASEQPVHVEIPQGNTPPGPVLIDAPAVYLNLTADVGTGGGQRTQFGRHMVTSLVHAVRVVDIERLMVVGLRLEIDDLIDPLGRARPVKMQLSSGWIRAQRYGKPRTTLSPSIRSIV